MGELTANRGLLCSLRCPAQRLGVSPFPGVQKTSSISAAQTAHIPSTCPCPDQLTVPVLMPGMPRTGNSWNLSRGTTAFDHVGHQLVPASRGRLGDGGHGKRQDEGSKQKDATHALVLRGNSGSARANGNAATRRGDVRFFFSRCPHSELVTARRGSGQLPVEMTPPGPAGSTKWFLAGCLQPGQMNSAPRTLLMAFQGGSSTGRAFASHMQALHQRYRRLTGSPAVSRQLPDSMGVVGAVPSSGGRGIPRPSIHELLTG